jgi:hypothetical protein
LGWKYSQVGIRNTIKSKAAAMTTWVTVIRMNSSWSWEAKPQQRAPWMERSQKAATGKQENQLQIAKPRPIGTLMMSMPLQSMRMRGPLKTRRYWRSRATLMKVADKG